jgi:hypothetical protein
MPIFKTTNDILSKPWSDSSLYQTQELPIKEEWLKTNLPTFDDIDTWEEIYYQPGNVGIYAAWSPYVELFIITHDLFLNQLSGIEIFSGGDASENAKHRARQLGIVVPTNTVWVNSTSTET